MKKKDYDTKISENENKVSDHNHDKYITTREFNILGARAFNARLAQADLVTKVDFDAKLQSLNKNINLNKTKHVLVENEFKKLEKFDAAYCKGKNYFGGDDTQNYLVFQQVCKYFERVGSEISSWKSKGLSNEKSSSVTTSDGRVSKLVYDNARIKIKFNGDLLKLNKVTYNHGPIVKFIYLLLNILVLLYKSVDIDKNKYSGFDSRGSFTHPSGDMVKMLLSLELI